MADVREAIIRATIDAGIPASQALAWADRESGFNPNAKNSKTIYGLYQMRGDLRHKHGAGDSDDPYLQTRGFASHLGDLKKEMRSVLGRDPTAEESYLGHHFGGVRAAQMLRSGAAPVDQVFSPQELAQNPHIAKAGDTQGLMASTMADIKRRQDKFRGADEDFSMFGRVMPTPQAEAMDFSSHGVLAPPEPQQALDFSSHGTLIGAKNDPIKQKLAETAVEDAASRMPDEIPPDAVLAGKGISPSRKHGDAMDFNSTDILRNGMGVQQFGPNPQSI